MNNIAFLQMVSEKLGKVSIHYDKEKSEAGICLDGKGWPGTTLDQSIADMKEHFAIKYLEQLEPKK
jgi:hypothetical protein